MGKTQNYPLRAFTPSEEQELHHIAKATSERLDVVISSQNFTSEGQQAYKISTAKAERNTYQSGQGELEQGVQVEITQQQSQKDDHQCVNDIHRVGLSR